MPWKRPVFWLYVLAAFVLLFFTRVYLEYNRASEVLDRLEQSMLDQRLRFRAQSMAPAQNIYVVAIDETSKDYFADHPELGIDGATLPRKWLARVVDYLNEKGARSVILDVELKNRQTPEDDKALQESIAGAKNVFVTAYHDIPLTDVMNLKGEDAVRIFHMAFFETFLQPQITADAKIHSMLPGGCKPGPLRLGMGAFQSVDPVMGQNWRELWQQMCEQDYSFSGVYADYLHNPDNPLDQAYARRCLFNMYALRFRSMPEFLTALDKHGIVAGISSNIDSGVEQHIAHCRVSPVLPEFLDAARGLGISSVEYDKEAFLRSVPALTVGYNGNAYAYMGVRAALDIMGDPPVRLSPDRLSIGERHIDLVDSRGIMINWRHPARNKRLMENVAAFTFARELAGEEQAKSFSQEERLAAMQQRVETFRKQVLDPLDPEKANPILGNGHLYRFISVSDIIKRLAGGPDKNDTPSLFALYGHPMSGDLNLDGAITVYGDSIKDIHLTPVGDTVAGPEIIATVVDNILHDKRFVHRSPVWMDWLCVAAMAAVMVFAILRLKRLHIGFLSGVLVLIAFWMYNFVLFSTEGLWIPLVWPTLAALAILTGTTLYRYNVQDKEKRELTGVFSKYVSPQIMNRILTNPATAMQSLQGSKKELTVMFSDIHNFTSQFQDAEPDQIVQYLNDYFNTMTNIVLAYEGTCDKYMGDSLMAFFGAPTDLPDHAEKACRAALTMQKALDALNIRREMAGKAPIKHGIGISTGEMFVGNFGSDEIKNFSVVGSVVNLGARLETQTRAANVPIIISEATYAYVKHWARVKDLGEVTVKGFSKPVQIYALLGENF